MPSGAGTAAHTSAAAQAARGTGRDAGVGGSASQDLEERLARLEESVWESWCQHRLMQARGRWSPF